MADHFLVESPFLDGRLSYLRRASALASRASLFVLTPVSADQLPDFVQSLQEAVFDAAMEYYANHTKRIRRKKARLPPNQFGVVLGGDKGRTLGSQGWTVRYEWKAGWFAELRQDFVSARRSAFPFLEASAVLMASLGITKTAGMSWQGCSPRLRLCPLGPSAGPKPRCWQIAWPSE